MSSSTSASKVSFFFQANIHLTNRRFLKGFIVALFKREAKPLRQINFIFCSDKQLLDINRKFLQHDYYTDIITFDLSEEEEDGVIAEVYISVDRVRENSRDHGVTLREELHRVIFHGALHLCGYKDKKPNQQAEMRKKEDFYLRKYFH